jgi:hypothetical protein
MILRHFGPEFRRPGILARRELASGMAGKKRLTLIRGGYRQAIASKLATAKRRQAAAVHMWVWSKNP